MWQDRPVRVVPDPYLPGHGDVSYAVEHYDLKLDYRTATNRLDATATLTIRALHPVTTLRLFNRNLPSSGGGYFRLLPYALSRWMLRRVNASDREAAVFYFHPWEIDPDQPRIAGIDRKTRFRHYVNIHRMERRLQSLLRDFKWGRMDRLFLGRGALAQ